MPLSPGERVDRYRIVSRLGAGGMGEVYRAHDTRLQREVALKILHADSTAGSSESSSAGSARILREAQSVAALEHPNVITIHDVGEIAEPEALRGTPYIAMELVRGKSLRQKIDGPPTPLVERVAWLVAVAQGLGAAHKAGLVHRDVKPENVMIRDDGVVKVLDFGIAKRSFSAASVDPTSSTEAQLLPQLTTGGVVVGTPYYMAPEQMRSETLDGRADQFSWGVMAYELLTGMPPWKLGGDSLQLVAEVLSADPPPPSAVNPEIPPSLEAVILRALAKRRDARFPSMSEVVAALSPAAPSSRRSFTNEQDAFAQTAAAVLVVPAPLSGRGSAADLAPPSAAQAPPAKPKGLVRWGAGAAVVVALVGSGVALRSRSSPSPGASASASPAPAAPDAGFPDFGSTMSKNADAVEAYRTAMSSFRDADTDRAMKDLDGAVRADPSFAAAQLRLGLSAVPLGGVQRSHFQEAIRLRSSLGAHDQALVDAFAPVSSAPGDLVETSKRLKALAGRVPSDADFQFQLCRVERALGEYADAIATCSRASALDSGAAAPIRLRALAQMSANDVAGGRESFEACLRVSPLATSCLASLLQLQTFQGDCDAALATARRYVSADRASEAPYELLANILMGAGEPLESVRTALGDMVDRMPAAAARVAKLENEVEVAIHSGDFAGADAQLRAWESEVGASRDEDDHFALSITRIELALEEGRTKDAKSLAQGYLAKRPAWTPNGDDDPSIIFYGVLYRTGSLARADFVGRQTKWLAWKKSQPRGNGFGSALGFAWIAAYARSVATAEDAREAIDALPEYLPLPDPLMWSPDFEEPIGRTYLLAGAYEEAITYLSRAAKSCGGLESPFTPTWASLELGEALEASGKPEQACADYRVVVSRWGSAKTSRSAARAAARLRALACSP